MSKLDDHNEEQRIRAIWSQSSVDRGPSAAVMDRIRDEARQASRADGPHRPGRVRPLLRVLGQRSLYAAAAAVLLLLGGVFRAYRPEPMPMGQNIEEMNAALLDQLALVDDFVLSALSFLEEHAVSDEILLDAVAMHISIWEETW